jgi:UDP-glucose 4-epimerase
MKILVTGGAGFIASHIADAYIAKGHRVVVLDNLSTGSRRNLNRKAKFVKADVRDARTVEQVLRRERPDVVNHHAAMISVVESVRRPDAVLETNVFGTMHLAKAFAALPAPKKRKFILASTGGAIYGDPQTLPADETYPAIPLAPYGVSKLMAEEAVKLYARLSGFAFTLFRYTNVFGPRQNPKGEAGVIAIFTRLMKAGKRPIIFGDGTKARDYLFVDDVARANVAALRKGKDETLNLGTAKLVTDDQVFRAIADAVGYGNTPRYAPYRTGEVYRISLRAARAKKILGWAPTVPFREGVARTVLTY